MCFDDTSRDGQAKPAAAMLMLCPFPALELIEDLGKLFRGDAIAPIADVDVHHRIISPELDGNGLTRTSVFDGIVKKVVERVSQHPAIAADAR